MQRYKITHETRYAFSGIVQLMPHTLRLRPREGHELRLESSLLEITPHALVRWHRDVEGNSVAIATFENSTTALSIRSEFVIQQYDQEPLDFLVSEHAVRYPFQYLNEELMSLLPYMRGSTSNKDNLLMEWLRGLILDNEDIQTIELLTRLNLRINRQFRYQRREEEGVQSARQTFEFGSGSCRDFACLFIEAARELGLAARFVSGYLYTNTDNAYEGSTHAWAEVFLPGAGWKGFDPTLGIIVGPHHIAVAVARQPDMVPPVSGSFIGPVGVTMTVAVQVKNLPS